MRRTLAVSFLLAVPLAFSGAARADAACVALLHWHGGSYFGYGSHDVAVGARLAEQAIRPGCNDVIMVPPLPPQPDTPATVRRIAKIDPRVAFHDGDQLYVNASTFPALPSHPLHDVLGRHLPWQSAKPCRVRGTAVLPYAHGSLGLQRGKQIASVRVRATTDVRLRRFGTGYVPAGAKIVVDGQRCVRVGRQLVIDAKRIARR